jgi:hypothetical protein
MNRRCQMQGGQNWILPKVINEDRFFSDSHWLEIRKNQLCPSKVRMDGVRLPPLYLGKDFQLERHFLQCRSRSQCESLGNRQPQFTSTKS